MAYCNTVSKVYVKLDKGELFDDINKDIDVIERWKENKSKVYNALCVVSVFVAILVFCIAVYGRDTNIIASVILSLPASVFVEIIGRFIYLAIYSSLLNYTFYEYTDDFVEAWNKDKNFMRNSEDNVAVYKWLMTLPNIHSFIPNSEYIRIVLNDNFLCDVGGDEGSIWSKATGKRINFYLDSILLSDKLKMVDPDDLILIITEKYHYLMDVQMYESEGICEVFDNYE